MATQLVNQISDPLGQLSKQILNLDFDLFILREELHYNDKDQDNFHLN